MSLLEDLLVEDDLLRDHEPDELETIEENIENDTVSGEENAPDENQDTSKTAEPKKRIIKNPQPKLNADRLRGSRGIATIEHVFKDIKLKGKGHEKSDLDQVMWRLEHWCHRLYPKFQFDDCLEKIEKLGSKKVVKTYVNKVRQGIVDTTDVEDLLITEHLDDEEEVLPPSDEFDQLLDEQISHINISRNMTPTQSEITDEIKERIARNREIAKQKLIAKRFAEEQQLMEYQNNFSSEQSAEIVQSQSSSKQAVDESVVPSTSAVSVHLKNVEKSLEDDTNIQSQLRFSDSAIDKSVSSTSTESEQFENVKNNDPNTAATNEQLERIERQRQLAIQRRLDRMKARQMEEAI